jgi:hypothetical protein
VLKPSRRLCTASSDVTSDLPTPPFPLTMPIAFLTLLYWFKLSKKLCGAVRMLQLSPQVEQLCVQFSLIFITFFIRFLIYRLQLQFIPVYHALLIQ